ncbi:MAG: ribosome small subunit-dependent GTPase A [Spirochaetaceae bacterium]|jgi:ribosome biogenesis GTPase|nr:ribosome small subunit-dependent GTPase A [Spirochaetaceae bacterium]
MDGVRALVVRGSRNIFTVRGETGAADGAEMECRIKGKILKEIEGYYNPLAPGDRVRVDTDPLQPRRGRILGVEKRRNFLTRFNQKGQRPQILGANLDTVFCVTSPLSPPFRPRFLDRLLVQAEIARIKAVIICNKYDLYRGEDPDTEERLEDFCRIGYEVLRVSAKTGLGVDRLRLLGMGKTSILLGQSGVGKSSLINALNPPVHAKTGALNEKYDRGSHTTSLSQLIELPAPAGALSPTYIIDTPGIRRMVPDGIKAEELVLYMKEFAGLAGLCTYGLSCSHRSEPGCKIMEAVAAGKIHEGRYESFLRISDELAAL